GIILCGSCGKPMRTSYHTDQRPSYECSSHRDRLTTPACRSVAAATVPAAGGFGGGHRGVTGAAERAVERARYEAGRAERAFCQVEPENRLVARSLEARWEDRLPALAAAEQALEGAP